MGRKYFMTYPVLPFEKYLTEQGFKTIKQVFYEKSIMGYHEKDIDKNADISVLEFDMDAKPDLPYFSDTTPEEVTKSLLPDYLLPVLRSSELNFVKQVQKEYRIRLDHSENAVLTFKGQLIDKLESFYKQAKDITYFTGGFKKPFLESIKRLIQYVNDEISTRFIEDFKDHKLIMRLSTKELCHFMVYLNEKGYFDKKYEDQELIALIEWHFQSQVGTKNEFKNIVSAKNDFWNSFNSERHNGYSDKLEKILVDYQKVLKPKLK